MKKSSYYVESVYDFFLRHGYQFDSMFKNSTECIIVRDNDSCYGKKLFVKMSQRGGITRYSCGRRLFYRGKEFYILRSGEYLYCRLVILLVTWVELVHHVNCLRKFCFRRRFPGLMS